MKKGPWVDPKIIKKVQIASKNNDNKPIKTWSRACTITPEMVGFSFAVHNGKDHINVKIIEEMVGHKLGEFSPTRKFKKHGGKIAREEATADTTKPAPVPTENKK